MSAAGSGDRRRVLIDHRLAEGWRIEVWRYHARQPPQERAGWAVYAPRGYLYRGGYTLSVGGAYDTAMACIPEPAKLHLIEGGLYEGGLSDA